MNGMGTMTWWGITPALDLQSELAHDSDDLNILLIGASDCRHILKTLAHSYRHKNRKINIYVTDTSVEHYARHLLLMGLALEPQERLGLQEKTEMFLELFANTLVRQQCMEYVQRMSTELIGMITNSDQMDKKLPLFDLSNLKFKERDLLEGVFKFWRNTDSDIFDIQKSWDLRLRQHLGVRYDAVPNVFDWDFHMKLVDKGGLIINNRKYNAWRHKGVAYEIREASYNTNNRTLGSMRLFQHAGDRTVRLGYWGDIVSSPYIAFGIESEEKSFFKTTNNILCKTSEDVSVFNVMSMFHELVHHSAYQQPDSNANQSKQQQPDSARLEEIVEENEEKTDINPVSEAVQLEKDNECEERVREQTKVSEVVGGDDKEAERIEGKQCATNRATSSLDGPYKSVEVTGAKIYLLPLNCAKELCKKQKYQRFFQLVYISNSLSHQMTSELSETFADGATVIMDTAKFILELNNEQTAEFVNKITELATSNGCRVIGEVDKLQDAHIKFKFGHRS